MRVKTVGGHGALPLTTVIPGWSEGPDPESRDSGFDAMRRPGMTIIETPLTGTPPMALVLNEEQSMLRDSARGLISDKAPVSHLRQLRDAKDATGFSRDLWKAFAEMGFSGLLVPEQFGGSGLGCVEAGVGMEEIGRTLMPSPFLSTAVLAVSALLRGGSEAQKSEHLPKISDGSLLAALAVDEGTKHRPLHTKLQAIRSGNGFRLSGAKAFV